MRLSNDDLRKIKNRHERATLTNPEPVFVQNALADIPILVQAIEDLETELSGLQAKHQEVVKKSQKS